MQSIVRDGVVFGLVSAAVIAAAHKLRQLTGH